MLLSKWLRPPASQAQNSFEKIRNERLFALSQVDSDNGRGGRGYLINMDSGAFEEEPCLEGPVILPGW